MEGGMHQLLILDHHIALLELVFHFYLELDPTDLLYYYDYNSAVKNSKSQKMIIVYYYCY
jgi:hypothetical protein